MRKVRIRNTILKLKQGDITEERTDAVVNAANSTLLGGGGVDGAIHRKGGGAILEACKEIRERTYPDGLPTGEAVVTTGGQLHARKVIHTVGPVWRGGTKNEEEDLASAYRNCLERAAEHQLRTVAFPSISTGAYRFPILKAARIALEQVLQAIRMHPDAFDEITFVLFSEQDYHVYEEALDSVVES